MSKLDISLLYFNFKLRFKNIEQNTKFVTSEVKISNKKYYLRVSILHELNTRCPLKEDQNSFSYFI